LDSVDVSPQTIRQVEFREKLRGYHQDDVDEFLERVAAGLEILQERLRQATERAVRAEQAASDRREDDESLRRTLVLAQRTADLAIKEAREQAARLMEEAEKEAAAITADAEAEARRLTDEAQVQAREEVEQLKAARGQLRDEVDQLVRYLDEQRARAKAVLTEAARDLDQALTAPAPPASTTAAGGPGGRRTSPGGPGERGTLGFAGMHPRAGGPGPRDARPGP